jgi:hypothetical protein
VRCIMAILQMKLPIEHAIERMTRSEGELAHAEPINHPQTLTMSGLVSWSSPTIPSTAICGEKQKFWPKDEQHVREQKDEIPQIPGTLELWNSGTRNNRNTETPPMYSPVPDCPSCHVILCGSYRTSPRPPIEPGKAGEWKRARSDELPANPKRFACLVREFDVGPVGRGRREARKNWGS